MSILLQELKNLMRNLEINALNPFQTQVIPQLLNSQNTLMIGEPGAGKTLSYILALTALTSQFLHPPQSSLDISSLFTETSQTPAFSQPHGSLIILPTNEKLYCVYQKLRKLSPILSIKRANTMFSAQNSLNLYPINKPANQATQLINVAKNTDWNIVDILLATPKTLSSIIQIQKTMKFPVINPKHIVIDEIDWICASNLNQKLLKNSLNEIPSCLSKHFIFTSNTLLYSKNNFDLVSDLKKMYLNIKEVHSEQFEKIPKNLNFEFFDKNEQFEKLKIILKTEKKIVVFCSELEKCEEIVRWCCENGINSIEITNKVELSKRIYNYSVGGFKERVIVCSEIGARGFEIEADQVVMYGLPSSLSSLVKGIDVAKQRGGTVTFFLNEEQEKFGELFKSGEKWDSLREYFSAKVNINAIFSKIKQSKLVNK